VAWEQDFCPDCIRVEANFWAKVVRTGIRVPDLYSGVLNIMVDVLTAASTFVFVFVLIKFPKAPPEPLWEFSSFSFLFRLG
jgi:hypothetical protein